MGWHIRTPLRSKISWMVDVPRFRRRIGPSIRHRSLTQNCFPLSRSFHDYPCKATLWCPSRQALFPPLLCPVLVRTPASIVCAVSLGNMALVHEGRHHAGTSDTAVVAWSSRPAARRAELATHRVIILLDCGNLAQLTVDDIMAKLNGSPSRPDPETAPAEGRGRQIIPIMPLASVKFPTESIHLQLYESRYRAMFKLIKNSRSQQFGISLTDTTNFSMESVGVLCRLRSLLRMPHQGRLLTTSRALSRFVVKRIVADKPFILAEVELLEDQPSETLAERTALTLAETRVWDCLKDVCHLAEKLYGDIGPLPDVISPEVRRWYWNSEDAAGGPCVGSGRGSDTASGSMHDNENDGADFIDGACDISRSEKFSFAVARTVDMTVDQQQELLAMRDTRERLEVVLQVLSEGRGYLAARSSLKDVF
eukprot:jgi/Mesvir1/20717/Mv14911-RA.3